MREACGGCRIVGDENGQNTQMEASDGRTRELGSFVDERQAQWEKPVARGSVMRPHVQPTHALCIGGQLSEKDTHVRAHGSLVVEVLASG